MLPYL